MKHFPALRGLRLVLAALTILLGAGMALCVRPGAVPAQETRQTEPQKPKDGAVPQEKQVPEKAGQKPEPRSARWRVSWGVDADTEKMNVKPVPTTIAHLLTFKRPADLPGQGTIPETYRTQRIKPIETTVWSVTATLVEVAAEHDGDYRLTLQDAKGGQIIGVLPDPSLAPKTGRFSKQIDAARKVVAEKLHPTFTESKVRMPVQIIGLGYFGRFNKEENPSPEGFQLHPVFSVRFPNKGTGRK